MFPLLVLEELMSSYIKYVTTVVQTPIQVAFYEKIDEELNFGIIISALITLKRLFSTEETGMGILRPTNRKFTRCFSDDEANRKRLEEN